MKKIFFLFTVLFTSNSFSQETTFKEYSFSQLFELIEAERDTIFHLKDAKIVFDSITDKRFKRQNTNLKHEPLKKITINKHLKFEEVFFDDKAAFYDIHFKKNLSFTNSDLIDFEWNTIDGVFNLFLAKKEIFNKMQIGNSNMFGHFRNNTFNNYVSFLVYSTEKKSIVIYFTNNTLHIKNATSSRDNNDIFASDLSLNNITQLTFQNNTIHLGEKPFNLNLQSLNWNILVNNTTTGKGAFALDISKPNGLVILSKNIFSSYVVLDIDEIKDAHNIDWTDFKNRTVNGNSLFKTLIEKTTEEQENAELANDRFNELFEKIFNIDSLIKKRRVENLNDYNGEITLKGKFLNHYRAIHNKGWANGVYVEIKDLETERLQFLYNQNPSFKTLFKWRINQFLKVFSGYGTEPEKAVIFSMYVILLFAFIYLLFPNSWDTLGNRRLMSRFEFFQKYLRRKEGMHTIYLEGKKEEISSYKDFKANLENSKTELPSFFINWSKPLYNASMFSSKLTSRFLQNTDILKGKWTDLTPKQKRWKNIQIGLLLTLGLFYDLFIKALNALMLSINTFTTLGFGEIPIKGLPRYLAIIQGFIGWFMLTIFSVSLISQLLN